jgi:hypothetical protein
MNSTAAAALVENILLGCINDDECAQNSCPDCNEIVMVARSERIVSKQNGSNRLICNPLQRGVEYKILQTVQNSPVYC